MDVELRFKDSGRDAIGYLTLADAAEDGGIAVKSDEDYQYLVREVMGASNRQREIFIVDSMESARAVAMASRSTSYGELAISKVADDVYAFSMTYLNGNYDDGIPLIVDLRETGRPLTLIGEFSAPARGINVEVENGDLELVSLAEDQSAEMTM